MPEASYLAPAPNSRSGDRPWNPGTAAGLIQIWQTTIDLHDEQGRPFRFTAHQLRHTYATRLINADVPQEAVRRLLDHESHEMTARYARLKDETVRRHWEQARKINIHGEILSSGQDEAINDAAWMKENLGRVTMALPNGYCGLPLQQACPYANACLTCPVFVTTPDFLNEHLNHLRSTNQLIAQAESVGQTRLHPAGPVGAAPAAETTRQKIPNCVVCSSLRDIDAPTASTCPQPIRQLTDENHRLQDRLARAHGALREARR